MISKYTVMQYCKNYTDIENYDKAISDTEHTWICHHKLEAWFSRIELEQMNRYYNVSARELVFCKNRNEHFKYPHKGFEDARLKKTGVKRGPYTQEHRDKISKALKGKKRPDVSIARKGMKFTEEHKRNLSIAAMGRKFSPETILKRSSKMKGHIVSEETRRKIGLANSIKNKGKHWKLENGKRVYYTKEE